MCIHETIITPSKVVYCQGKIHDFMLEKLKASARQLKTELFALTLAYRDPRTPWHARLFAGLVLAYAFSPIDLIPDPIPVLGYLDDLLLVPIGIWLALRMIPPEVLAECRQRAKNGAAQEKPISWAGAVLIGLIWLATAAVVVYSLYARLSH